MHGEVGLFSKGRPDMGEQLSFPGLAGSPCPTEGLFFAIFPTLKVAGAACALAGRLRSEHGLTGTPLMAARLHVSLYHLGDYAELPRGVVKAAAEAATSVAVPPFVVAFDRVASFNGGFRKQALVLLGGEGVTGLLALHQHLGKGLQDAGLWRWVNPQYEPHMTLLYDQHGIVERPVETVDWTVREFVLVHSRHGRACYDQLGRWQLGSF